MSINDGQLLEAAKQGNMQTIEQYYLQVYPEFLNWSYKQFHLPSDKAIDIFQDAFIVFYEKLLCGDLQALNSSCKTYLFAIAKNMIGKHLYRQQLYKRHEAAIIYHISHNEVLDFLEQSEQNQIEQVAIWAVQSLQEPCRSILEWFYFHRMSLQEIAQRLGYKNANVMKNKKFRCLQKLRYWVEEQIKVYAY